MAIEMYMLGILIPAELQGISVGEPVVRHLLLIAVYDLLLEHTVMITDAAAVGGIVESRQRIQEACCQSAQTAVTQSRVGLLVLNGVDLEAQLLEGFLDGFIGHQVDGVIAECAAHQEFHGQIDQGLGILLFKCLLCLHPAVNDLILQGQGGRLEDLLVGGFFHCAAIHGSYIVFHTSLEQVFVEVECRSLSCHILSISAKLSVHTGCIKLAKIQSALPYTAQSPQRSLQGNAIRPVFSGPPETGSAAPRRLKSLNSLLSKSGFSPRIFGIRWTLVLGFLYAQ